MEHKRKKKMKKSDIVLLVVLGALLLTAVLVPTLRATDRMDRADRKMSDAGYLVTHETDGLDEDLAERVVGRGGPKGEFLTVLKFKEKEKAAAYYDLIKDEYTLTQTAVLAGRYVYYGTRTAYELVK